MIETLAFITAMHFPVQFERQFVNRAWGYINQRCVIDNTGQVWFQSTVNEPTRANRVDQTSLAHAKQLALESHGERYFTMMVAADMGDAVWSVNIGGEITNLQTRGNHKGGPASDASAELVQMIDSWCADEPRFPSYINDRP